MTFAMTFFAAAAASEIAGRYVPTFAIAIAFTVGAATGGFWFA